MLSPLTPLPPPFASHCFSISVSVTHSSPVSVFSFTSLNTFSQFSSLSLSLYICFSVFLFPCAPWSNSIPLYLFPSSWYSHKHTLLLVCRAEQSCRKWILEGQFNMTGLGLREECTADLCVYKSAWVCAYFWQRPHLMMLLVSLTDGS